ncbi:dehydratase [Phaeacidiphilus oryzae]|uniref:dehydratase n=1 Tax=Phaeacidiphilus oryzae TaxID=348818 RepID=UPI0005631A3C|nr:dehydratase [Phaeacidiphilus oryzae]
MSGDPAELMRKVERDWHPGETTERDAMAAAPVAGLSAVYDLAEPVAREGDPLPLLWHWLYFLEWPRQSALGEDGHPAAGHFLPPLPQRRRMFAGGRLRIESPLIIGREAVRTSRLGPVRAKRGRSGDILFVTVVSEFAQGGEVRVVEEQDIVYRIGDGRPPVAGPDLDLTSRPKADEEWQLALRPGAEELFRVSALTANTHRIHYDQPYVTGVEGYPGLVVHGPLLALTMLELCRREAPGRPLRSYAYRLRKPVFAGEHLLACGEPAGDGSGARLRVATVRDGEHATGEAVFG